jgi:hypothetical protein
MGETREEILARIIDRLQLLPPASISTVLPREAVDLDLVIRKAGEDSPEKDSQ